MSLGIQRLGHVALTTPDPAAAAAFATEHLGFTLAGTDPDGSHLLAARGADEYALVYVPGQAPGLDHAAYVVPDAEALERAAAALQARGVAVQQEDGTVRFSTPAGHRLELITGPSTEIPVAHLAEPPALAPAPICPDHLGVGAVDFDAELAFAQDVMGMLPSNRVLAPDGTAVMTFLRFPGRLLYHQLVVASTPAPVLHHVQFTLKSLDSFYATHAALLQAGVEVQWGPLRHGPGHNVACYFQDGAGIWFEYSVEEEIILDDEHYVPRTWSIEDPHVIDEWNSGPPPEALMGPPPGVRA
ncbi:MAG: glyoxalase/bleomycin resistance protein/dioxygenase [Solirubrobacterales bacterium]|nr:glyoxalase/bleomycin resistance protein/dioxygenase [Solirubrobacterales bacterium]